jgi:hypothetical protein
MLKLPVTRGETSERLAYYQTAVPVSDIVPYILGGNDPRSSNWGRLPAAVTRLYEKLQRKTVKSRREEVERYIKGRMAPKAMWIGAFPPIVIGVPPTQEFKPHDDQDNYEGVGLLKLKNDPLRPNAVIDGLGRLTGLLDIAQDQEIEPSVREWANRFRVPLLLITGHQGHTITEEELGQLFYDFNVLGTPVSRGHALDLDLSDPYITVAGKVGGLKVIKTFGGMADRATTIAKEFWTTKTVLLKAVRAAAEGPGAHVDHIRDAIANPWMSTDARKQEIVDRFDVLLVALTDGIEKLPEHTLMRKEVWWVALGLVLHDLHRNYNGGHIPEPVREEYMRKLAAFDWSLGNDEINFLGSSVPEKDRKTGEFKPAPADANGRPIINRFHGGSKAYFNLAAFLRRKIGLYSRVNYGEDFGTSVQFDPAGKVVPLEGEAQKPGKAA